MADRCHFLLEALVSAANSHYTYIQAPVAVSFLPLTLSPLASALHNQSGIGPTSHTIASWLAPASSARINLIIRRQLRLPGQYSAPQSIAPAIEWSMQLPTARDPLRSTRDCYEARHAMSCYLTSVQTSRLPCNRAQRASSIAIAQQLLRSLVPSVADEVWRHPSFAVNSRMGPL